MRERWFTGTKDIADRVHSPVFLDPLAHPPLDPGNLLMPILLLAQRIDQHCRKTLGNRCHTSGIALSNAVRPLAITSPYSESSPRRPLICIVRNFTGC
jgi:hypothetical protein